MKKAQSQIITTVLIILLVLAAIVIVWQVVNSTVRSGAEQLESQSACLGLNLVVVSAVDSNDTVTIRRDPGAGDQTGVGAILFVNGVNQGNLGISLNELDSDSATSTNFVSGNDIQIAGVLSGGTLCPLGPKETAVA